MARARPSMIRRNYRARSMTRDHHPEINYWDDNYDAGEGRESKTIFCGYGFGQQRPRQGGYQRSSRGKMTYPEEAEGTRKKIRGNLKALGLNPLCRDCSRRCKVPNAPGSEITYCPKIEDMAKQKRNEEGGL